ncbi:MAG: PSD1 and planctomycete cytochrome C domain-containing protein [Pirellulaceae bacterium]|nr:PSD1 and planctomycete cytochrome C domain-containing protein [Pirellulaceae bacterium]
MNVQTPWNENQAVRCILWVVLAVAISRAGHSQELPPAVDREVDFVRDVQPILRARCWSCHGAEKQESGLRLDRSEAAFIGGDSGKAILRNESAKSLLIQYVSGLDADHIMPPEGQRLSSEQIGLLRTWIDRGAQWPASGTTEKNSHWAYQPLKHVSPPKPKQHAWVVNPIDNFVLEKLESQGISPSAQADRYTLIRRLSLDLTGLLPTVEQVDAFVNDAQPNAYEAVVDRLLDSPHFGERWGRHWLDMARYADSDGYEKDNPRPDAYRYRDWVIDAINTDMPFDQFTIEQLAGDLLPEATDMQRLATAFHRQTLTNTEGGTDQEQFRVEACFDRTETTGAVWLGLTVGCARCHTHKYDAITQREYYQLFAFFNNGDEQTHVVPKSVEEIESYRVAKAKFDDELAQAKTALTSPDFIEAEMEWENASLEKLNALERIESQRRLLDNPVFHSEDSQLTFKALEDNSFLVSGDKPLTTDYTISGQLKDAQVRVLRLDLLTDSSLPKKGPGRAENGNFVISEVVVESSTSADFSNAQTWEFTAAKADYEQNRFPATKTIDGKVTDGGWAIANETGKPHWLELQLKDPLEFQQPTFVRVRLHQQHGTQHTIGRCKITFQSEMSPEASLPEKIVKLLKAPREQRSESQQQELVEHFAHVYPATQDAAKAIEELKKKEPSKPEVAARVLVQRTKDPRKTLVLRRGEFLEPMPDAEVQPSGFSTLPQLQTRSSVGDRLDLARWLVSKENPLTPRVTVNHVWRLLFGTGIVKTANDFGVRGELPTHPELLDWLAAEFIGFNDGRSSTVTAWSRKSLIKNIVMSATYRQSSAHRNDLMEVDPQNRLLARQNRMRVEGEIVRDISLDVAGLLSRKVGGPSVYPLLPPGIAELSYAGNFKWNLSEGADRYRRGMYTFFKRTAPHPNLITFDCPDANLTCVDRSKSNTPLQALVALNNESFAEAARALAVRALNCDPKLEESERLALAFRWCVARPPTEYEISELENLLKESRQWYESHNEDAKKLMAATKVDGYSPEVVAAWIATARILINLDEFITRE